jgi:hypothetical protein
MHVLTSTVYANPAPDFVYAFFFQRLLSRGSSWIAACLPGKSIMSGARQIRET